MGTRDWTFGISSIAVFALLAAGTASAGPWTLGAGEAQVGATYTYTEATDAFDEESERDLAADYYVQQLEVLAQFGALDYLTVYMRPTFQWVDVGGVEEAGHSHTDLGLRLRLHNANDNIFSVQAELTLPGDIDGPSNVRLNSGEIEAELRAAFGRQFNFGSLPAYFTVEGGFRYREGPMPDEWIGDVTLGWAPDDNVEFELRSANVWAEGNGDLPQFDYYRQHQIQAALIFHAMQDLSLEIGGFYTWGGQNVVAEQGIFAGGGYRF